jgi:hypothetical protein
MDKLSRRRLLHAGTVMSGLVIAGSFTGTGAAHAAPAPRIYTRAEWSARPPRSAAQVLDTGPDHIVVHHTASANSTDYSLDQAFALSHWIQDLHMDSNGWADSGQQLTISRGGYVMEGRNRSLEAIDSGRHCVGAQTAGQNNHTIGIENEGLYTDVDTTPALFDALVATCAWLCTVYGLDPHEAIVGHRDYVNTQCPGNVLYARLPELRDRVAVAL